MAAANPLRFSTKFQDDETGLLYYGYRYYDPSTGRWNSKDPAEESESSNLLLFVLNNPMRYCDPVGLRVFIMPPSYRLDSTHFDDAVLAGLQRIIGDCAKLQKSPIVRQVETGFLVWKATTTRLVAWQISYSDENPKCVCSPCWKYLKAALAENIPTKDIFIYRGLLLDNAYESSGRVSINESVYVDLPTLGQNGEVIWENTPFDVVLWHEVIGHAYRGLKHPNAKWNRRGGSGKDPTILEENNARNCLRLQGISINDRVPTYYGWDK